VRVAVLPRYAGEAGGFVYMSDGLGAVADVVRARLQDVGRRILEKRAAMLDGGEDAVAGGGMSPAAFYAASPNVVLAVGRVRVELDGEAGAGRINWSSVVLESEDGNMVKLGLARLRAAGRPLFLNPGMIVAVEGINTNGRELDVHAIHDDSSPLEVDEGAPGVGEEDPGGEAPVARMVVAAGPYTLPGNLKFEPLDALLAAVMLSRPDVVVLLGPFLDVGHKLVNAELPVEFDALFEARFVRRLSEEAAQSPGTRFVVVPALSDAHHVPVCPQPAFSTLVDPGPSVHFMSNPCAFTISNAAKTRAAVVGVTSLPTMLDMSSDSLCSDTGDRIRSLVSHIIRQWSFYPQFPASPVVPMDSSHSHRLELPDCGLDALVTPSVLQPFLKAADGDVVALNPGLLVRGAAGGGAYAVMSLPLHRNSAQLVKPSGGRRGARSNSSTVTAEICRL
jgi:DNA polymerase alpha subunit B